MKTWNESFLGRHQISVNEMIKILECDIRQFDYLDDEDLDNRVEFRSDWGTEHTCSIREIQYTYKFCKRLLEMCRDAGYIK